MRKQQNPVRVYFSQSNPDEWHVGTAEYTRFFMIIAARCIYMTKKQKVGLHKSMVNTIIEKETIIAEELAKTIISYYNEQNIDFEQLYKDILNLMYISLKQTYRLTISESAKIYSALTEQIQDNISNEEIDNYTYSKDNLVLAKRVKNYIDDAKENNISRDVLLFYETRILDNETLVLHHKLLKSKLKKAKIEYGMVVTGGGCDRECCNNIEQDWMPIDEIDEPPYHPNCTCEIIYDDNELDDEEV